MIDSVLILYFASIVLLFVAAWIDFKKKIIPDVFPTILMVLGFITSMLQGKSIVAIIESVFLMLLIAVWFYQIGIWEGGDVKLLVALASFFSVLDLAWFVFFLLLTDLIWLVIYRTKEQRKCIPYGPAILISFLGVLLI